MPATQIDLRGKAARRAKRPFFKKTASEQTVPDFRCDRSAWQVSQIVAFGIFSSYLDFAYLIAGVIHAPLLFWGKISAGAQTLFFAIHNRLFYFFIKF